MTILIISLLKVGDAPISYQNNAFFILILNSILFGVELRLKPFGIPQLNDLNLISNLMMMITIFGGLFSSINQQTNLSLLIMIVILFLNIYFILVFLKCFIQIKLSFFEKINKCFVRFFRGVFNKFWHSGLKHIFI